MAQEKDIPNLVVVRVSPDGFLGVTFGKHDIFGDMIKVLPFEEDISPDNDCVITMSFEPEKLEIVDLASEDGWVKERYEEIINILTQMVENQKET